MRKCILLAVFLLCMVPSALAAGNRTSELSRTFYSGDTFKLDDDIYTVDVNSYEEIIIRFNDQFVVVRNGSCSMRGLTYEFCADDIGFDFSNKKKEVDLSVYSYKPDIAVTRTVSKSDPLVGETINVSVTLENQGARKASNVTYTDTFPPDMNVSIPISQPGVYVQRNRKVKLANGSTARMHTVFWQGEMIIDDSTSFLYRLTPLKQADHSFSANVHYMKGLEEVDEETDSFDIKAEPYLVMKTNLIDVGYKVPAGRTDVKTWETKDPLLGEHMLFVVDIVNRYKDNNSINMSELRIHFPPGIRYEREATLRVYDNASDANSSYLTGGVRLNRVSDTLYNWSGKVIKDGKTFVMKVRAVKKGTHRIRVAADIRKGNLPEIYDYSATQSVEVTGKEIEIESNFADGDSFNAGQEKYFTLYLANPNTYANFTDINVTMDIPWSDIRKKHISLVEDSNYKDVLNKNIVMPDVSVPTPLKFYVNVSYRTQFGKRMNKTFKRGITVQPVPDFDVIHEIGGKQVLNSGSMEVDHREKEVVLRIDSNAEEDLNSVTVREVYNSTLNPSGGLSTKLITLRKGRMNDVFKYKINPPDSNMRKNYTLTTYVAYRIGNHTYNHSLDAVLTVKPKMMDIRIIKELFESTLARGQTAHFSYRIKNTENEPINNITIHFPLQRETDVVGAREFVIDSLKPGETAVVNNEERVRVKKNGTLSFKKTNVTFRDEAGNIFNDTSNIVRDEVEDGILESPAIFMNKSAPSNVTEGEQFEVELIVKNKGGMPAYVTVRYPRPWYTREYTFRALPGSERRIVYNTTVREAGLLNLPDNIANHSYKGFQYYTVPNKAELYSNPKKEPEPVKEEEEKEKRGVNETGKEQKEGKVFNIKYLYLAVFIVLVCLAILYVIRRPKKKKGFEFLEE